MNKTITASPRSAKELYWALKQLPMQRCLAHGTRSRGQCGCSGHMFYSPADNKVWAKNPLTGQIKATQKPMVNPARHGKLSPKQRQKATQQLMYERSGLGQLDKQIRQEWAEKMIDKLLIDNV